MAIFKLTSCINVRRILGNEVVHFVNPEIYWSGRFFCIFVISCMKCFHFLFQEDKKLVHGYVCTKNILVVKDGLDGQQAPFIKLSNPGVSIATLNREGNEELSS